MSDKYYDNKGVPHYSSAARDSANTEYLRQDDDFRSEQARTAKEILTVQKIQAQIELNRHFEQIEHNKKIQAININEAEQAEAHRQFERDIHWLGRSDAKGRFEYIVERNKAEIHQELANRAINNSKLDDLFENNGNTSQLMSRMVEYIETTRMSQDYQSDLTKVTEELKIIQKKIQPVDLYFALSMLFTFFAIFNIVLTVAETLERGTSFLNFLLSASMAVFLWKTSASIRKELKPLNDKLIINQKELQAKTETLANRVKQCFNTLRDLSTEWKKDTANTVDLAVRKQCRSIEFVSEVKCVVGAIEKQYPSSLRVSWAEVSPEDVLKLINTIENDIVHFAITDQVGPQILLAQIKKLDPLKALAIEARYGSLQHVTGVVYPSNLKRKTEEMEDDF